MVPITIVNGVYKPSYNWGAPHPHPSSVGPVSGFPTPLRFGPASGWNAKSCWHKSRACGKLGHGSHSKSIFASPLAEDLWSSKPWDIMGYHGISWDMGPLVTHANLQKMGVQKCHSLWRDWWRFPKIGRWPKFWPWHLALPSPQPLFFCIWWHWPQPIDWLWADVGQGLRGLFESPGNQCVFGKTRESQD